MQLKLDSGFRGRRHLLSLLALEEALQHDDGQRIITDTLLLLGVHHFIARGARDPSGDHTREDDGPLH